MHDSNPSSWEALVGSHKLESGLSYKGRFCLKGEKKTEDEREWKEMGGEEKGNGEGKHLPGHGKSPARVSCPSPAVPKSGSF